MVLLRVQDAYAGGDTIRFGGKPFALLRQTHIVPPTYAIESFEGIILLTVYPGKVQVNGQQYYIITFTGDRRQAAFKQTKNMTEDIVRELLRSAVLKQNNIDTVAEKQFIKAHPIPKGYPDAEQLNEFGKL